MLFAIEIGSSGEGDESYSLRLPFTTSPGKTVDLSRGSVLKINGKTAYVSELEGHQRHYVLTLDGFSSANAAADFLPRLGAALFWFALEHHLGVEFNGEPALAQLYPEPLVVREDSSLWKAMSSKGWRHLDGDYHAQKTTVYPNHRKLIRDIVGPVEFRNDIPLFVLEREMAKGIEGLQPERVIQNPKLRLAFEVYLSAFYESSTRATFLSRVTVLEVLAPDRPLSDPVMKFVDSLLASAKANLRGAADSVQKEYQAIISTVRNLKCGSIKHGLRSLFREGLPPNSGFASPSEIAEEVCQIYDLRSRLVHKGTASQEEVQAANARLQEIIPTLLKSLYRAAAQSQ